MPLAMTGLATSAPTELLAASGSVQATSSFDTLAEAIVVCATRVLYRSPFGEGHSLASRTSSTGAPGGTGGPALAANAPRSVVGALLTQSEPASTAAATMLT